MYEMKGRIRYSEIGYKNELTPISLVNYFQDSSTFQSEDIGLGLEYFQKRQRAWLLSGWQIDIQRMPLLGEEVNIRTWPYGFMGFIGFRNYVMEAKDTEVLAAANAIWTWVDTAKRCPAKIEEDDVKAYPIEEKFDMEYAPRRIKLSGEGQKKEAIQIGRERIDTNGHMNNGHYISLAEEYLEKDVSFNRIRVEYKKEVKYRDKMIPVIYHTETAETIVLENEEGQVHAVIEFGQQGSV